MVFGQLSAKLKNKQGVIFLGAPEAEAEALPNSKLPLASVYKDYCELVPSLANEKFIIVGRKGSGKSAFAEYICHLAEDDANLFSRFIRKGQSNIEHIVQIGKTAGHEIERENLYKWLILTNILKLFTDNEAIKNNQYYSELIQFLNKNSGYIDIRNSEIQELVERQGFEISVEYLKRFFSSKLKKNFEIRQTRAPFYKLIPHLRDVLLNALTSPQELENKNSYVLFFDDLDISFDANDKESINNLIALLRVSKEFNNEFFAKNKLDSKIVILLRDDISKKLASFSSDTAKIFSSYAVNINWYQDEYQNNENEKILHIRQFLNDRVRYAFEAAALAYNDDDSFLSLVEEPFKGSQETSKSSFKYVLDHTLFRPRDLLLFFKPLATHRYKLPLSKTDVNHLIGLYCEELVNEIKNELSCFYSGEQIAMIFSAFGEISSCCQASQFHSISYENAIQIIEAHCTGVDSKDLLEDMFSRSLIGNSASNRFVYFKHREPATDTYEFSSQLSVIVHSALKVYCSKRFIS